MELTNSQKLNFVGALLLLQKRRDDALGLRHVTTVQRGWIWYYNLLQRRGVAAVIYQPIIKELARQAEGATPEQQAELLKAAEKIEHKIMMGTV